MTLPAPAELPPMTTWPGSPPNLAMLSCNHSSAMRWSFKPARCVSAFRPKTEIMLTVIDAASILDFRAGKEPIGADTIIDGNDDDFVT